MTRKSAAERQRTARWEQIVSNYQRRHRQWVMISLPRMSPAHWKLYEHWVAGFGSLCVDQASRNSRKMRRRLRAARVTGTVTRQDMFMTEPSALAGGAATNGRATRR